VRASGGPVRDPWVVHDEKESLRYRDEAAKADVIIAATPVDAMPKWWPGFFGDFPPRPLRKTILHVITETATHAGHLDAYRELADGGQWLVLTR
jgi:hypothetical protein